MNCDELSEVIDRLYVASETEILTALRHMHGCPKCLLEIQLKSAACRLMFPERVKEGQAFVSDMGERLARRVQIDKEV